jgi:hypothetical protein
VPLALLAPLVREIDTQERLLAATQRDNERLTTEARAGRAQAAAATAAAAAPAAAGSPRSTPAGEDGSGLCAQRSRGVGPLQPHESGCVAGSGLRGVLQLEAQVADLREQLAASRAAAHAREGELKQELDASRRAKVELECRLGGGVDMPALASAAASENDTVRRMRQAAADAASGWEREKQALAQKVAWYRDNQRLLDADAGALAQQAAHIAHLRIQLTEAGLTPAEPPPATVAPTSTAGETVAPAQRSGDSVAADLSAASAPSAGKPRAAASSGGTKPALAGPPTRGGVVGSAAALAQAGVTARELAKAQRRVRELEGQVASLDEALKRRHPDSLALLIREAKGASGAAGEPAQALQELQALRAAAKAAEEGHERSLRALRQEHERLRAADGAEAARLRAELQQLRQAQERDRPSAAGAAARGGAAAGGAAAVKPRSALQPGSGGGGGAVSAAQARVRELEAEVARLKALPHSAPPASTPATVAHTSAPSRAPGAINPGPATGAAAGSGAAAGRATGTSSGSSIRAGAPASTVGGAGRARAAAAIGRGGSRGSSGSSGRSDDRASAGAASARSVAARAAEPAAARSTAGRGRGGSTAAAVRTASGRASAGVPPPVPRAAAAHEGAPRRGVLLVDATAATGVSQPAAGFVSLDATQPPGGAAGAAGRDGGCSPLMTDASGASIALLTPTARLLQDLQMLSPEGGGGSAGGDGGVAWHGHAVSAGTAAAAAVPAAKRAEVVATVAAAPLGAAHASVAAELASVRAEVADLRSQLAQQRQQQQAQQTHGVGAGAASGAADTVPPALQLQLQQLRAALDTVERRAELREQELLRAERAVADAASAAEAGIRAHYEEALRVKDAALLAARGEITALYGAFLQLQQQQQPPPPQLRGTAEPEASAASGYGVRSVAARMSRPAVAPSLPAAVRVL